jgi:hypothetical protein
MFEPPAYSRARLIGEQKIKKIRADPHDPDNPRSITSP